MKANTPSRTAQYMALFRAIEHARPQASRLFADRFAIGFLDTGLRAAVHVSALPLIGPAITKIIHYKAPGALSSGIARTKYIDDLLQQTLQKEVRQVLILGAGFDTRALRLGYLKNIPVIEIDHPDTAAYKLQQLKAVISLPANIHYLQLDFNKENLAQLADKANINFSVPTTIIWEGVTNYLTAGAVSSTFDFIKRFAAGSFVIFTYIHKQVLENPASFEGTDRFFKKLDKEEEPWTFGFYPEELPAYLKKFNLHLLEDKGAADYRQQYMPERKSFLKGYEFYRVAMAEHM